MLLNQKPYSVRHDTRQEGRTPSGMPYMVWTKEIRNWGLGKGYEGNEGEGRGLISSLLQIDNK
jgi:hypothetical protein